MEEIEIIKKQLLKLKKKGIGLDIVNDTIVLVDYRIQSNTIEEYNKSTNKWDGMAKDHENYDKLDVGKYIIAAL